MPRVRILVMVVLFVLAALAPAGAVPLSSPVATAENVTHLETLPGNTGGHVAVDGNRAYMGNYGTGMTVYDITNPKAPSKIGQWLPGPSNTDGADPGARADAVPDAAVWDGRHIVALGGTSRASTTTQTEFIDFTNPAAPVLLHRFRGSADGEAHNSDIVDERKLWLPSGGNGGMGLRIYDMSPLLESPTKPPKRIFAGNPHTLWQQSPYRAFYGKPAGAAFNHTHDISIYVDRTILLPEWDWVDSNGDGTPDPTTGQRDIALLAAAGAGNNSAMYVLDITDPRQPIAISKWQNPTGANDNAIAYLHEAQFLDGDPNTIYIADEDMTSGCNEGRVYTVNITDNLADITKLGEWTIGGGQRDLPVCLGAHVFSSHDRHVFMGAYAAGLQILDLTDPSAPKRAGRFVAEGMNSWGATYHNGVIYVGDMGARGLDVFQFNKAAAAPQ